ncbi:MAG: LPS-assembly protein LptD, partial [Methylophilaceae bacterium]
AKNDNNYFSDMSTDIAVTSQVSLPQEAFISYSKNNFNAKLFTQKFQNLTNSSPYERLPSLTSSYYKYWDDSHGLPFLTTDVKFSYTQFERNNNYIGTSATGSRLSSTPSISAPIEADYGYIIPKLKLNLRNYNLKNANVKSKTLVIPTISVDSGLYFDKSIGLGANNYTQTLEPRAFYSFTPYKNQSMLPMFDTGLTELNAQSIFEEEQFAGDDRIMDSHQITLALSSSIIDNKGFEWVTTTVAQRFYLDDRKVLKETQFANSTYKNDTSDIFFDAKLHLTKTLQLKTDYQYNVDESHTNRATIRAKYKPEPGKVLNASYRLVRNPNNTNTNAYDIKQFNLSGQLPLGHGWSGLASYNYDILKSTVIEGMGGVAYDAGCWSVQAMFHRLQLATTSTPNDTFFLQIELGGLGSLGTGNQSDLFEKMNRNVPGSLFASDLPDKYRENNFK